MSDDQSSESDDQFLTEFLQAFEAADDAVSVLKDFCNRYPDLADRFKGVANAADTVQRSRGNALPDQPQQLGEFHELRRIAIGGMGEVYQAVQKPLDRKVVVKTIRRDRTRVSLTIRERFVREQAILAKLHHTNIVPIHTAGEESDLQFFAMPFIDGLTLDQVVDQMRKAQSPDSNDDVQTLTEVVSTTLSNQADVRSVAGATTYSFHTTDTSKESEIDEQPHPADAKPLRLSPRYFASVARAIIDAAEALHHAHQVDVLHRDVKPSNLMLDRDGQCWIIDFGLAAFVGQIEHGSRNDVDRTLRSVTMTGLIGTPQYMSPEQWQDSESIDQRSDVWGLGVTLYELLTLRRAFDVKEPAAKPDQLKRMIVEEPIDPPNKHVGNTPRPLRAIVEKATAKSPDDRYPSALELANDLRRWLNNEPTSAEPGIFRAIWLWVGRNKALVTALVCALISIVSFTAAIVGSGTTREVNRLNQELNRHKHERLQLSRELNQQSRRLLNREVHLRIQRPRSAGWRDRAIKLIRQSNPLEDPMAGEYSSLLHGLDAHRLDDSPLTTKGPVSFDSKNDVFQLTSSSKKLRLIGANGKNIDLEAIGNVPSETIASLALSANGRFAIGATIEKEKNDDGRIFVWDLIRGNNSGKISIEDGILSSLAISNNGKYIAYDGNKQNVVVLDIEGLGKNELTRFNLRLRERTISLAFWTDSKQSESSDDEDPRSLLAVGDEKGVVTIWDFVEQTPRSTLESSQQGVFAMAFNQDGSLLASAGLRVTRIWNVDRGEELLQLPEQNPIRVAKTKLPEFSPDGFKSIAFSKDGSLLLVNTGADAANVAKSQLWNLENTELDNRRK